MQAFNMMYLKNSARVKKHDFLEDQHLDHNNHVQRETKKACKC